ncbi:hypothetical protein IAU59_006435 [Kwoniella sp. CBS 9459]
MSAVIAGSSRPLCRACIRSHHHVGHPNTPSVRVRNVAQSHAIRTVSRRFASEIVKEPRSIDSHSGSGRNFTTGPSDGASKSYKSASGKRSYRRLALTIFGIAIPTTSYLFFPSSQPITPHLYSNQPVVSTKLITPQHKLITVDIPPKSKEFFERPYRTDGSLADVDTPGESESEGGEVVIQHMMIKSPDIQIERPYTPINDPVKDGNVRMVVKRVRGGEVGRVVHSLKGGDEVGIRGPIPTFSIYPNRYDRIIMISTGTAISPFLQLISKLPSPSSASTSSQDDKYPVDTPRLHLIHAKPLEGRIDWTDPSTSTSPLDPQTTSSLSQAEDPSLIPSLQAKFGKQLHVTRIDPGYISREVILSALGRQTDVEGAQSLRQEEHHEQKRRGWFSSWFGHGNGNGTGDAEASVSERVGSDSRSGSESATATAAGRLPAGEERVMILVCLPPALMRPLCGGMTANLDQGELTGLLADLGLRKDQVWKLE